MGSPRTMHLHWQAWWSTCGSRRWSTSRPACMRPSATTPGTERERSAPQVASTAVPYEFKLPDLGEGLTEGEIARWLVAEGDEVAEDQPLVEIATDKTTVEIPSPVGGKVAQILVGAGEVVPVGTLLVVIGADEAPRAAPQATPVVRRIAKDLGVPLESVRGTGPG